MDKLLLSPEHGGQDDIVIRIRDESNKVLARGYVQVTYGNLKVDEGGGIGDGCSEDKEYCTSEIRTH